MVRTTKSRITEIGGETPTNGGMEQIEHGIPYTAKITVCGTADFLFHRWNCEEVDAKSLAAKGSKSKKTDNIESYVYRNTKGEICVPGEYLRMSIIGAAKFLQDPRSPRKSAMDLFKAGFVCTTVLASLGQKTWDYEDRRRVTIQRNSINRTRPAIKEGWTTTFEILVNLPEYISPKLLHDVTSNAGRLIGLGDFRPTYGRFQIVNFNITQ